MKFLTISNVKDIYYTLPKAERDKIGAATMEYIINQKKKMGDKMHFYSAPGGQVYSISEFDSLEEYSQSLRTPRAEAGFVNFECIPVTEMDEKAIKAYEERAKAAK